MGGVAAVTGWRRCAQPGRPFMHVAAGPRCRALQPKHPGQFNFPHFLILGFPKTATTSLFQ